MSTLHNQQVSFDSGKLPGGRKGIYYFGFKIKLSLQKILKFFKINRGNCL